MGQRQDPADVAPVQYCMGAAEVTVSALRGDTITLWSGRRSNSSRGEQRHKCPAISAVCHQVAFICDLAGEPPEAYVDAVLWSDLVVVLGHALHWL